MRTYNVTIDLNTNVVSCNELDMIADCVVHSDETLKWFNIRMEAENPDHALGLAAMYFDKFLIDKANEKYNQIWRACLNYSKELKNEI